MTILTDLIISHKLSVVYKCDGKEKVSKINIVSKACVVFMNLIETVLNTLNFRIQKEEAQEALTKKVLKAMRKVMRNVSLIKKCLLVIVTKVKM